MKYLLIFCFFVSMSCSIFETGEYTTIPVELHGYLERVFPANFIDSQVVMVVDTTISGNDAYYSGGIIVIRRELYRSVMHLSHELTHAWQRSHGDIRINDGKYTIPMPYNKLGIEQEAELVSIACDLLNHPDWRVSQGGYYFSSADLPDMVDYMRGMKLNTKYFNEWY